MNIRLFNDFLDALERVAADIRAVSQIPKRHRYELLTAVTSAYTILDGALLLVVTRLGKLLERAEAGDQEGLANELERLPRREEWLQVEREMSLCSALRRTRGEMKRLLPSLLSKAALRDWNALESQMDAILLSEFELAGYITNTLGILSVRGPEARASKDGLEQARREVQSAYSDLDAERRRLIKAEAELYNYV